MACQRESAWAAGACVSRASCSSRPPPRAPSSSQPPPPPHPPPSLPSRSPCEDAKMAASNYYGFAAGAVAGPQYRYEGGGCLKFMRPGGASEAHKEGGGGGEG